MCKLCSAVVVIHAGIIHHKVLNDRRHLLTKDSDGQVVLWDILSGQAVETYGAVDFAAKERELFKPVSVPSWFTSDIKLGAIALHLETPSCFSAEAYACK